MLKKQTIWLITMLSLMIVLSAYYMMADKSGKFAYIDQDQTTGKGASDLETEGKDVTGVGDISNMGQDQLFSLLRMELQDKRSVQQGHLKEVMSSNTATTEEKSEALSEIQAINDISSKETILQNTILAKQEAYHDVLVRLDKDVVHVHLIVDELPKDEVVQIMQMVRDEFGEIAVNVNFDPYES